MQFEIIGTIENQETFATGKGIRELSRLEKIYGKGKWRKRKGIAEVRLADGAIVEVFLSTATSVWDKHFVLTADIHADASQKVPFPSIGSNAYSFTGTFDVSEGDNYVVTKPAKVATI